MNETLYLYTRKDHPTHTPFAKSIDPNFKNWTSGLTGVGMIDVLIKSTKLPDSNFYLGEDSGYLPAAKKTKKILQRYLHFRFTRPRL
ncbi:hypothetical protein AKJ55_01025 [candidate division MSBL1 archaeon SCGC-AAA382M17]|uniref:Uncharacterized protein n=1 Tax=candidate division MSBL1 archaeon SCGC-AAA382M17 TaxID=1698284 RepID=A0ABR5TJM8_9EURY|nr:hypothetical protein AKJ55_01025 [candidate division MSBL1 archaeon SCGC-AAA382M17]